MPASHTRVPCSDLPRGMNPPDTGAHQHQPAHNQNQGMGRGQNKPKNKTIINIATLNLNGFASPTNNMSGLEKWAMVNRTINKHRIAVLAVQETHLDSDRLESILQNFGRKLDILSSPHPTNPRTSAGIAFVINRNLIRPDAYKSTTLIAGRAIELKLKWHESTITSLINVYAPNSKMEHPAFWEETELS